MPVDVPAEIRAHGFRLSAGAMRGIHGSVMLEAVAADEPHQLLELGDVHHGARTKRLQRIVRKAPLMLDAVVGTPVVLDAGKSGDRYKNALQYSWFFYSEAGGGLPNAGGGRSGAPGGGGRATGVPSAPRGGRPPPTPRITITNGNAAVATVMPNTAGVAHVILAVTDNGVPALTSYRRVVLTIQAGAR